MRTQCSHQSLAHIGVIQWLAENGYQLRSISGASIGALVGGIYATDKLPIYAEWVLALERIHVLRELIGDCAIEVVNPVPIAPTLEDDPDLTVVVNLSGPAESRVLPAVSGSLIGDNGYRKRIARFIDGVQAMQDTISQLRLSGYAPDVKVEIPRNACGFFEFWRAEELITLGRERAAQAFARLEQP